MGSTVIRREDPLPPLLTRNRLALDQDGQVVGEMVASWNWPFARSLLDVSLTRNPNRSAARRDTTRPVPPFLLQWYHATTTYMLLNGMYGDLTPHLQHAADLFPDDARILYDRACYAELWGLPMHQALRSERDLAAERLRERQGQDPPTWTTPGADRSFQIPPAEKTNTEAERLFRLSVSANPSLIEARVRLARLLEIRGRFDKAAAQLKPALDATPQGVVAFYARLFAGRAAQALGKLDEAAEHYRAALALFPDAQSALLASS